MPDVVTIGDATLYHGDCLEILPTFAAESVDMVWTDPPYGHSNHADDLNARLNEHRQIENKPISNDDAESMLSSTQTPSGSERKETTVARPDMLEQWLAVSWKRRFWFYYERVKLKAQYFWWRLTDRERADGDGNAP